MASVEAELRAEVERLQAENRSLQTALAAAGREQHAALGRERAIVDVLHVIGSSSTDLRAALDAIVQRAAALCRASASRLWLREGDAFAWIASWGETPEARVGEVMSRLVSPELAAVWAEIDQPLHWTLRGGRKSTILSGGDAAQDFQSRASSFFGSAMRAGIRTVLNVPLRRAGATIGVLALSRVQARLFEEIQQKNRELAALNAQLQAATAAKSQFLSTMSHELRTPLNAVIGYAEMLAEEAQDAGHTDMLPDLDKITGAGRHLLSLINTVLDLSKIEAGRMELALADFPVQRLLDDVAAVVPPLIQQHGNQFVLEAGEELGSMHSDQTKLRQCLLNLLSNAAKFTEAGTITLAVRREPGLHGDQLTFAVSDTGIGMTDAQVGKLFQTFMQAEAGTSGRYGGTGLGLALSREFARLLGGDISVQSEPGKGSTFTLSVPANV